MIAAAVDPSDHSLRVSDAGWEALLEIADGGRPRNPGAVAELEADRVATADGIDARIAPHVTTRLHATHSFALEGAAPAMAWSDAEGITVCRAAGDDRLEVAWAPRGQWSLVAAQLVGLGPRAHPADPEAREVEASELAQELAGGASPGLSLGAVLGHWKLVRTRVADSQPSGSIEVVDTDRGLWMVAPASGVRVRLQPVSSAEVWTALIGLGPP